MRSHAGGDAAGGELPQGEPRLRRKVLALEGQCHVHLAFRGGPNLRGNQERGAGGEGGEKEERQEKEGSWLGHMVLPLRFLHLLKFY